MIRIALLSLPVICLGFSAVAQDYDPFQDYDFGGRDLHAVASRQLHLGISDPIESFAEPFEETSQESVALAPALAPSPSLGKSFPDRESLLNLAPLPAWKPSEFGRRPDRKPDSLPRKIRDLEIKAALSRPEFYAISETHLGNESVDGWVIGQRKITSLLAEVDLETQTMTLSDRGKVIAQWPVSTAKVGKTTRKGTFGVTFLSRNHKSRRYDNSPMPCAIFYNGHEAIHGTSYENKLGSRASEGCVRVRTENACFLHDEVQKRGEHSLTVVVR